MVAGAAWVLLWFIAGQRSTWVVIAGADGGPVMLRARPNEAGVPGASIQPLLEVPAGTKAVVADRIGSGRDAQLKLHLREGPYSGEEGWVSGALVQFEIAWP